MYALQMAIPDYQSCMLPFLRFLGDETEHALRDAEEALARHYKLTAAERAALLPSGQQGVFKNRIGWARTYLKKAGLIEATKRGVFKITARGLKSLVAEPSKIDNKYLEQFAEFIEFRDASRPKSICVPVSETGQLQTTLPHFQHRRQLAGRWRRHAGQQCAR